MSPATLMSAEQLLRVPDNRWYELVEGELESPTDIESLTAGAGLDGRDLLPGFRCPIADLFVNT